MQLKKVLGIFSAVLVAFSCSCLPAVISPAYADNAIMELEVHDYNSDFVFFTAVAPSVTEYSSPTLSFSSSEIGNQIYDIHSSHFQPVNYDRTLYIDFGMTTTLANMTMSNAIRYSDLSWTTGGATSILSNGAYSTFKLAYPNNGTNAYDRIRVTIPANCTYFKFTVPPRFNITSTYLKANLKILESFIVNTGNTDVADLVSAILDEVRGIHGDTGNMLTVLNGILTQCTEINADTTTIITILNAIKSNVAHIDTTTTDIYNLLHDSLQAESAEVDRKSQAVADSIMQQDNAEQFWNDKNTDNFNALDIDNFTFGSGVVTALGTVGGLFSALWDSLGDTVVIFTFPLMLGITLVAIGRVSRSGGKGSKGGKGGDGD